MQYDEIWAFCYAKKKNLTEKINEKHPDAGAAFNFMTDVASRLKHRVQLTTDAHRPYLSAVEDALGAGHRNAVVVQPSLGSHRACRRN